MDISLELLHNIAADKNYDITKFSNDELLGIMYFINNLPYDHSLVESDLFERIINVLIERRIDLTLYKLNDLSFRSRLVNKTDGKSYQKVFLKLKAEFYNLQNDEKFEKIKKFIKNKLSKKDEVTL